MNRALRALPSAVLVAVVAAALVARVDRRPHPTRTAAMTAASVGTSSASPASPFDEPLRAPPDPPPAAVVSAGAPRMLHGSPRHVHRTAARGPRTARPAFRAVLSGPVSAQVTASPDERTLYAATLDGNLVALAREDGKPRWTVPLGDRVYSTPLVADDGVVYVGSDAKRFFAVSPDGKISWKLEVEGEADSGATFGRDGVVVFAAGRYVYAVRRGGDLAWRFAAKGKVFTAPAVAESGLVVFGSQDDRVYALRSDGALAWSTDLGADVDGAPAIGDDGSIYVGTDKGEVVRLDDTGKIVWRTDVGGFVRGVLSIARNGDVLAGTYGPVPRVVRVAADGRVRGAFSIRGTGAREFGIHGGPLEDADGTLFWGAQDDAVYAVGADGVARFRFVTGADVDAPLTILSDGSLIVPSEDGSVTMLLP